jgi:hypothetical protein
MSQAGSGCSWRVIARVCARESIVVTSAGHLLFLANEIGLDRVGEAWAGGLALFQWRLSLNNYPIPILGSYCDMGSVRNFFRRLLGWFNIHKASDT